MTNTAPDNSPDAESLLVETVTEIVRAFSQTRADLVDHLIWRRDADTHSWRGQFEGVPTLPLAWDQSVDWDRVSAPLNAIFKERYPQRIDRLVGTFITGLRLITTVDIVRAVTANLWRPATGFSNDPVHVSKSAHDVLTSLVSDSITWRFYAPLLNFSGPTADLIPLMDGVGIKRLSEEEVTELRGGPVYTLIHKGGSIGLPEWALFGHVTEHVIVGEFPAGAITPAALLQEQISTIVRGLRTFQTGPVGCQQIVFEIRQPQALFGGVAQISGAEYVPFGLYVIQQEMVAKLIAHVRAMQTVSHPALEVACSRLGAGEIRLDARDRLIDAVVGMEAILLSSLGNPKYRGEVRFRFAFNYAFLQPPTDRAKAFKLARDLYDLRSTIAHGAATPASVNLAGKEQSFAEVATLACEVLRQLIKGFLADGHQFGPGTQGFWERQYFPTS